MGRKLEDEGERIIQKSIGFRKRQTEFFADHPEFKADEYCRQAVDAQISLHLDKDKYLPKHEKTIN